MQRAFLAWGGDVTVSGPTFLAILIGSLLYVAALLWAMSEAARRERRGWAAAIFVLGPVGIIAWIVRGRRQA